MIGGFTYDDPHTANKHGARKGSPVVVPHFASVFIPNNWILVEDIPEEKAKDNEEEKEGHELKGEACKENLICRYVYKLNLLMKEGRSRLQRTWLPS